MNILKQMKEKNIIIIISVIILMIILLILFLVLMGNKESITCKLNENSINGFIVKDELKFKLKSNKLNAIDVKKEVIIGEEYSRHSTYNKIVENALTNAYSYLNEKSYNVKKDDNTYTVKAKIRKDGVILKNLEITLNNPDNKYDLMFNPINNIESSNKSIKIGEEYTLKELKKKVESYGYTCK